MSLPARDNPFGSDRISSIRYRPDGWTWDEFFRRLAEHDWRGAVVGPEGSGKSTLLRTLIGELTRRGYRTRWLRCHYRQRGLLPVVIDHLAESLREDDIVVLDSAEQLGWFGWRRFLRAVRNAAGVVIAVHRPGRLPTLVRCKAEPARLAEFVRELSGREHEDPVGFLARHRGNMRDALRAMYDRHADGV